MNNKFQIKLTWLLPLFLFITFVIIGWMGLGLHPHELQSVMVGKSAPNFSGYNLWQPQQKLTDKLFQGKMTLLNVFATWCDNCRSEHPILMDIARDSSIQLIGLNYKDQDNTTRHWLQQYGNPYQAVIVDHTGNIAMRYGVYGTPETFLIDQQGIVRERLIGALTSLRWKQVLLPEIEKIRRENS